MNKTLIQIIITVIVATAIVTGGYYAFFRDTSVSPEDFVTDVAGITYLTEESKDGKTVVVVQGDDGNYYLAYIDENGVIGDFVTDEAGNRKLADVNEDNLPSNTTAPTVPTLATNYTDDFTQTTHNDSVNTTTSIYSTTNVDGTATTVPGETSTVNNGSETTAPPTTSGPDSETDTDTVHATEDPTTTAPIITQPSGTYMADPYRELFSSGTYIIEFTTNDEDLSETPVVAAFKDGNVLMNATLMSMDCSIIFNRDSGEGFLLLKNYKKYCKLPEELLETVKDTTGVITEEQYVAVDVSTVAGSDGEALTCETFTGVNGEITKYYFNNQKILVRRDRVDVDGAETCMYFNSITSDVPDSTFEIPSNYGFVNLAWANFLFN